MEIVSRQKRLDKELREQVTTVCAYGGAAEGTKQLHRSGAYSIGQAVAQMGLNLVYGGGSLGLMGQVSKGALDAGGHVTGIIPTFLDQREVSNHAVHELRVVADMHERKQLMFDLSQVFVVLPGGLGTLEEMFEVLTWKQLDQHSKTIILANFDGYWDPALELMRHMGEEGYLHSQSEELLFEVKSVEEFVALFEK
jgi:uncharacterized protein (TIGR00730 family)